MTINSPYPPTKLSPWDNQIKAWNLQAGHSGFYYAMDMGTGKSKSAIDYCNGHDARKVLILCPKKVTTVWPLQFDIHSYHPFEIVHFIKDKPVKKKAAEIRWQMDMAAAANRRIAVVLNYDAFWRSPLGPTYNQNNRIIQVGELLRHEWDVLICDEAHRLMSPGGRAAWGATRLSKKARLVLMLSGTPMPSNPLNIYAQFRVMNPTVYGTSFVKFKNRYALMGGFQNKQVLKYINQEELSAKFASHSYQCKKEEVLNLPPVLHEYRRCDLLDSTLKVYHTLAEEFEAEVINKRLGGGEISVSNALVKLLRLSQMTGGFIRLDDGREIIKDHNKLEVAQEILEDLAPDEPVVIFARFTNEVKRLREMAEKKCKRSTGEISSAANDLAAWQAGELNTLVVQIQSGGEGVDFTRACYCIYFSLGYVSPGVYRQSLARLDRPGQTRPVTYYHVIAKNTIDEAIYASHRKKIDTVEYVLSMVSQNSQKRLNAPFSSSAA